MPRQPRHPEYYGLTNDRVQEAMSIVQKAKREGRITKAESRIIMPILDASFDPHEKLTLSRKRTIHNVK